MSSRKLGLRLALFVALLCGMLWLGSGSAATNYDWDKHTITTWEANNVNCISAADIDGDGDGDCFAVATSLSDLYWFEKTDSGWTKHTITTWQANKVDYISAGDIDGDGDMDVYGAAPDLSDIYWWENNGEQDFTRHTITTYQGNQVNTISAADIDTDGDCDLFTVAKSLSDIYWWEKTTTGFTRHTISTWQASNVDCISAGDIDGDGDTDLYAVATSLADLYWWENDGSQNFTKGTITTWEAVNVNYIAAEDYDNDGDCDLIGLATSVADLYIWERIDTGWESKATITTWEAVNIECISAVNVDHLKGPDFYGVATSQADLFWWENETDVAINANWHPVTVTTSAPDVDFISAFDIDDDGDSDFFAYSETNGTLYTVEQTNPHFGAFQAKVTGLENVNQIAAGDPNGDGKGDCWILRQEDAKLQLALNNGSGSFTLYDVKDGCASNDHHMVPVDDGVYIFKPEIQAVSWLVPDSQDPSDYTETFVFQGNIIEGTTFATLVQKSEDKFYIAASMPERNEIWRFEEVIDGEDHYLVPHVITYNAPEGMEALYGADFEGSSFGSLAIAASASPMQLGTWNNDGGGTFTVEEDLSAVEIESASAAKVRSFGRSVSDLFILDPDGLTVRFLANRFVHNPAPTEPDLAYVASTLEPTYTLQEKDKVFKITVRNIADTGSITLNTTTKLEFGTSPKYEAYLSSETTVTTEAELVFDEETVPAGISSGAYNVTIQFRATGYSKDYVLPEKVHISPETLTINASNSPVIVRGNCDFTDLEALADGVVIMDGTGVKAANIRIDGKVIPSGRLQWLSAEEQQMLLDAATVQVFENGTMEGNFVINAASLNVWAGGKIIGDGHSSVQGPGYGRDGQWICGGGGGGFGTRGEDAPDASGDPETGSGRGGKAYEHAEENDGSSGGDGFHKPKHLYALCGFGGAGLRFHISGIFTNDGLIQSNGKNGYTAKTLDCADGVGGGGGSGGSIYINSKKLTGSGTLVTVGGEGGGKDTPHPGGDGGDGRIAIICTSNTFTGTMDAGEGPAFIVTITRPHGDPSIPQPDDPTYNNPHSDLANVGNERTFSGHATPAVSNLTVPCTATISPGAMAAEIGPKLRWIIEKIGDYEATWAPQAPGEEHKGSGTSSTATFTTTAAGLPGNNSDFGTKKVELEVEGYTGYGECETNIEVFWPLLINPAGDRDDANFAKNHPGPALAASAAETGGNRGASTRAPNWFYYWRRAISPTGEYALYDSTDPNSFGETPAGYSFNRVGSGGPYTGPHHVILIQLAAQDIDYEGGITTGIDAFYDTVLHENFHAINQTVDWTNAAFGLGITGATNVADNHWSCTIGKPPVTPVPPLPPGRVYNHYIDNNADGDFTDPGEDLDDDGDDVPNSEEPATIEGQAEGAEANNQDELAGHDWGSPGKNHRTTSHNN